MRHNTPKRPPSFALDGAGSLTAKLVLANGHNAILDATDLEELVCRGFTLNWTFNSSGNGYDYVRAQGQAGLAVVAREIMRPAKGQCVKYRNGNRLDLRRGNLYLADGARSKSARRGAMAR